jgi:acetyl esterase/lipase
VRHPLLTSTAFAAEMQVHRDLPYSEQKDRQRTLDVYAPADGERHPVVVWVHGGGWQTGDKAEVHQQPQSFVGKGFVFVSANYRLIPDATIQQMAGDVAKAIHWVHDHAREYGGDPKAIIVMGHSAGSVADVSKFVCGAALGGGNVLTRMAAH